MNAKFVEPLESRRLMSVSLGVNLVVNGDAETGIGASDSTTSTQVPGWTKLNGDNFTLAKYDSVIGPNETSPGPDTRGKNYLAGGPFGLARGDASLYQDVDLRSISRDIDAGRIGFETSAYLGGYKAEADSISMRVLFQIGETLTTSTTLTSPAPATRENKTGLYESRVVAPVPAGTRFVRVLLTATKVFGRYADGYADNVSFKLSSSLDPSKGNITGRIFDDSNGNGRRDSGELPMRGVVVFVDKNKNGRRDSGEYSAVSSSNGSYRISDVPKGSYLLREELPQGFRVTSNYRPSVTVRGGLTEVQNFYNSQTARITGTIFNDKNRNGRIDAGESPLEMLNLYLDLNDNGERDDFEPVAGTNQYGTYSFVVPFGIYRVRQDLYPGYTQTLPGDGKSILITIKKGQTVRNLNFADYVVPGG
ncbi:MAG: SdrD B-like domain-containing protein [Tepidisphaeraceae bacterium]